MIQWKCPQCARPHETDDDIKYVICRGCLSTMKKLEDIKQEEEDGRQEV